MLRNCLILNLFLNSLGCENLLVQNDNFPSMSFHALSATESNELGFRSGRATYITQIDEISTYLYHTVASPYYDGIGRWVISDLPGSNEEAQAFIDSFAVMPSLIHAVNDETKSVWKYANGTEFILDHSLQINCVSGGGRDDNTIYLEVRDSPFSVPGFSLIIHLFSIL